MSAIAGLELLDDITAQAPTRPSPAPGLRKPSERFQKRKDRYRAALYRAVTPEELAEIFRAIARDAKGECKVAENEDGEQVVLGPDASTVNCARKIIAELLIGKGVPMVHQNFVQQNLTAQYFGDNAPRIA